MLISIIGPLVCLAIVLLFFNIVFIGIGGHNYRSLFCKHRYEEKKEKICSCKEETYYMCSECGHIKRLD